MVIETAFEVRRGQAATLEFALDPPRNIAGWTIVPTAARARGSSRKAVGPTSATVDDAPSGQFHFDLSASDTDIRPAAYVYDVWRTDADIETLLASGTLMLLDSVWLP